MKKKTNKLTVSMQFDLADGTDGFSKFCKALLDGGFETEVRELAHMLLAEAERRKLPVAKKIRAALKK